MKKKDKVSLHSKSITELLKELTDTKKKLRTVSLAIAAGKEKNTRQTVLIADNIARVYTVISEKRRSEAKGKV